MISCEHLKSSYKNKKDLIKQKSKVKFQNESFLQRNVTHIFEFHNIQKIEIKQDDNLD